MVICKVARQFYISSQVPKTLLEAFRRSNPAKRANIKSLEVIQRQAFILVNVSQIERRVTALDNFCRPIVPSDSLNQVVVCFAAAFGDKNIARRRFRGGSRKVPRGNRCSLPKGAWRSIRTISRRCFR